MVPGGANLTRKRKGGEGKKKGHKREKKKGKMKRKKKARTNGVQLCMPKQIKYGRDAN